jgi:hypothetical protein
VLEWTVGMAKQLHAHIIILYTFRLLQSKSSEALVTKKRMEEQAINRFNLLERELLINKGLSYEFRSEVGFVTDRVEDHVKREPIHLLIVSKSMSTQSKEVFEELIDQIRVPLVIIPELF